MIRRDPPSLSFPAVDTGALRSVSSWFGIRSSVLAGDAADLSATLDSVGGARGGWRGAARIAWNASGALGVDDLRTASDAFSRVSQILSSLANQVDQARSRYQAAMGRMDQAIMEADSAQSILDDPSSLMNPDGPVGRQVLAQQQQRLTDALGAIDAGRAEAMAAQSEAFDAGSRAASALSDAAAMAAGIGTFAGQHPAAPRVAGAEAPPDAPFLTLLFGSVGDNYLSGRAFQTAVMRALGLNENFQTFQGYVGNNQIGTKPDSMGKGEVWEFKGVRYQHLSSQIKAEMSVAAARGQPFELVIGSNTKVSPELIEAVHNHPYGGEIVRMQKDGSFTDMNGNKVERAEGGGWKYPDDDDWPPGAGAGGGSLNHPAGFEADTEPAPEGEGGGGTPDNMVPILPIPHGFPIPMPVPAPMPVPVPVIP